MAAAHAVEIRSAAGVNVKSANFFGACDRKALMREFMNRYPLVAVILVLLAVAGVGAGDFSMLRAASHDGVANGWLEGRMCCRASRRSSEGPGRVQETGWEENRPVTQGPGKLRQV